MDLLHLPKHISICEVGPRDGLQNEKVSLSLEQKTELIERSIAAGVKIIEVGSFVSPKAIPSMADTDEVCRRIHKVPGVEYRSLIFNLKGLQRAEAAGLTKAKLTVSASRGHCLANMNKTPEEAVQSFSACVAYAKEHNLTLSGAISTAFGCSIDGIVPFEQVISVAKALYDLGLRELSLSDTTGMAHPVQVYQYCLDIQKMFPDVTWNLHFHNTRGLGLANVLAGMLDQQNVEVKIIDTNRERCRLVAEKLDNGIAICGDGTNIDLLTEEGIENADMVVCLTTDDKLNLMLALLAKQLGATKTIVRVNRNEYVDLMLSPGFWKNKKGW